MEGLLGAHRLAERSGLWADAEKISEQLIRYDTNRAQFRLMMGFSHERRQQYGKACVIYRVALERFPRDPQLLVALARSLHKLHQHHDALQSASLALEVTPMYAPAHKLRAIILTALGRASDALLARTDVIRCNPTEPESYLLRAIHYAQFGQPLLGLEDIRQIARLRPYTLADYRVLIVLHSSIQHLPSLLLAIEMLLRFQPNDEDALYRRAKCLEWLDRLPEAIDAFNECLSYSCLRIPALFRKLEILQRLFNITGETQWLTDAIDVAATLAKLGNPPLPDTTRLIQLALQMIA